MNSESLLLSTESDSLTSEPIAPSPLEAKQTIRRSLKASTLDGVFATLFSNTTAGVILNNFLVALNASPSQIGWLNSIPMVANLIQPIGAWMGDRTTSRHYFCLAVYGPSRVLWLILPMGIALFYWRDLPSETLVQWTLGIVFLTSIVGALGSASWLSWLAAIVPRRLRGRYFGLRNSAASLTNLVSLPLLGWAIAAFPGGPIQGFGAVLCLGVVAGVVSLVFQNFIVDVNPQDQNQTPEVPRQEGAIAVDLSSAESSDLKETPIRSEVQALSMPTPYIFFLVYLAFWMFAVNLSAPFFNLYMLADLHLDIRWVTIYNSLQAAANLLMLVFWGRLADRFGNRTILLLVGIFVSVLPLFWLGTSNDALSVWVWLPLLNLFMGGTWAAIDLCNNNLQIGVSPVRNQATYFGIVAAVSGVSGAIGTMAGGFLAEFADYGGLPGLFALSAAVRLVALLPLIFVRESHGQSLRQTMRVLFPGKSADSPNASV